MGRIFSVEEAKVFFFSRHGYSGYPFPSKDVPTDSKRLTELFVFMRNALILAVYTQRNIAQVLEPVVAAIPVNVINRETRPTAGLIEPCESMNPVLSRIDHDQQIPRRTGRPSDTTDTNSLAGDSPRHNAGGRIVKEKLTQSRGGKIGRSHDDL